MVNKYAKLTEEILQGFGQLLATKGMGGRWSALFLFAVPIRDFYIGRDPSQRSSNQCDIYRR
jgi:hypothetical protein